MSANDRAVIVALGVFGMIFAISIIIVGLGLPAVPVGTTYPDPTLTPPSATALVQTTTP